MKVSSYISKFLKSKGVNTVFELQGGMITRLIDDFFREGSFKIVSVHHEQSAAFAADAYARITGTPGIALATSGPGATNLITGIGSCYFDSVPAIFITGQVNVNEQKGERGTRQLGFQETDIVPMVAPITKAAFSVKHADDIPRILSQSYKISLEGRPGPVLIDIAMNVQQEIISESALEFEESLEQKEDLGDKLKSFYSSFHAAYSQCKNPLLLIGKGVRDAQAEKALKDFIAKYDIPLVSSLLGFDLLPYKHPMRVGFIGTYGNRWANYALGKCDLLLVLGSRLDLRQTGADVESFQKDKKIFHVDIDEAELNNRMQDSVTLHADLKVFLDYAIEQSFQSRQFDLWKREIQKRKEVRLDTEELQGLKGINPNKFIHALSMASCDAGAFIADVGNNQMWTAQSLELEDHQHFLTSGGMGAMGYALPAAIGASFALNEAPIVMISGDGGFQINIQELETIKRNKLAVKMVILNNQCLGMIRQFQDSYFDSCYQSTVWGYSAPDFAKVANAYGIEALTIEDEKDIDGAMEKLWHDPQKPFLLQVMIEHTTNAFPKLAYGNPISRMEPFFDEV